MARYSTAAPDALPPKDEYKSAADGKDAIIEDLRQRLEESEEKNRKRQANNFGLHRRNVILQEALDRLAERIPQFGIGIFPAGQEEDLESLLRREILDIIIKTKYHPGE